MIGTDVIYREVFKEMPADLLFILGWDVVKASGVLSPAIIEDIENTYARNIENGEILDEKENWDTLMGFSENNI